MDRIIKWTAVEIDRIWSCANADRLSPLPWLEEQEEVGDEDEDKDDCCSCGRSEPLALDDMDFGH